MRIKEQAFTGNVQNPYTYSVKIFGTARPGRIILEWIRDKQHVAVCTVLICSRELVTEMLVCEEAD